MNSANIKILLILVLAAFVAIYLGVSAATAQVEVVLWVVGIASLAVCVLLGDRIWMLLAFLGIMSLNLRLPGGPSSLLLAQAIFMLFAVPLFFLRKLRYRFRFKEIDLWLILLTIMILQVYVRNPVSISIFGGDTVGGKAYVIYAVGLVTYAMLAGLTVSPRDLTILYYVFIVGGFVGFGLMTFGYFVPAIGIWYGAVYNQNSVYGEMSTVEAKSAGRLPFLTEPTKFFALWLSSKVSPLAATIKPLWFLVLIMTIVFAALTGYRNMIAAVGLTYVVGILYRGGFGQLLIAGFISLIGLALLAVVNMVNPLPPNMQRALSFLPGTWEERYIYESEESTDWRVEIWKEVILTKRWIHNKMMGDGLGYSKKELQLQMDLMKGSRVVMSMSGFDSHRESILANGDYHSGPVQSVRVIGYVGLFVLIVTMIRLGVYAHRVMRRCKNTEYYSLALFVGIPLICAPLLFVFINGTIQLISITIFMGAGFLRIIDNNVPISMRADIAT